MAIDLRCSHVQVWMHLVYAHSNTIHYLNTHRLFLRCALKRISFRYVRGHWFKVLTCASPSPYGLWIDREQKNTENPRFRVLMHFRTNRFTCKKIHLRLHDYTLTIDYLNTHRLFRRCALKRMSFRYVRGHWFKVLACASPSPYSFWAFKYDRLQHVPTTRQIR